MTSSTHADLAPLLGPAALGLLTPEEQRSLDSHLSDCPLCRAELDDLAGVTDRLAELEGQEALLDDLQPVPSRAQAVLAGIAAERRADARRTQRWHAVVAAAASVVVLAAGVATAAALSRDVAPQVPLEAVAVDAPGSVDARADLVAHTWGVEIKLAASGLAEGAPYTVKVMTTDGRTVDAGAFLGTGDRTLLCNLNASVLREDAAAFVVLDGSGLQVLSAEL